MKIAGKHIGAAASIGITAIAAVVGILYYKNRAAKDDDTSANSLGGMGSFPYFQSAALPSSIAGANGGSGDGSSGLDITGLAQISTDLQTHVSDNSLQSNWIGTVGQSISDLIGSLTTAGFGSAGVNAALDQKKGGGFNFNVMMLPIKSNATGATYYNPPPVSGDQSGPISAQPLNVSATIYSQLVNPPDSVVRWVFPGEIGGYG